MDEESFGQLYEETANSLRRYLRHVLGDRALADDIMQEAYFRMLKTHLPSNMDTMQQKSYLYKVATNLIRDQRTARRLEQLPEGYEPPTVAPLLDDARDVREAFGQLKVKERDLLWLAYVECFRHDEIAQLVNTTPPSIRPMLARARDKFRSILRRRGFGGPHGQ
jgi:RNA polymerase sigma-70 factor, ECF subfamily